MGNGWNDKKHAPILQMMWNGPRMWLWCHWSHLHKEQHGHRIALQFISRAEIPYLAKPGICAIRDYLFITWTWNSIGKLWHQFWEQAENSPPWLQGGISVIFLFTMYLFSESRYLSFKISAHVKRLPWSPREKEFYNLFLFSSFSYLTFQDTHEAWISPERRTRLQDGK